MTKTFIVTGATGAIGRAIVDGLVDKKAGNIILAVRNTEKARGIIQSHEDYGYRIHAMRLDLADFDSVRTFAKNILDSGERIDGIFNNAGTMPGKLIITGDGYEEATQTNFLSTGLLTRLLLPAVNYGGSVVFTTSMTRHIARLSPEWDKLSKTRHQRFVTYGRSKLMLTHFAKCLADELECRNIKVNCSDPWIVNSGMIKMNIKIVDFLSDKIASHLFHSPDKGAQAAMNAMFSDKSGSIFLSGSDSPIPASYSKSKYHYMPSEVIASL